MHDLSAVDQTLSLLPARTFIHHLFALLSYYFCMQSTLPLRSANICEKGTCMPVERDAYRIRIHRPPQNKQHVACSSSSCKVLSDDLNSALRSQAVQVRACTTEIKSSVTEHRSH